MAATSASAAAALVAPAAGQAPTAMHSPISVRASFSNKTVMITGTTGFVGKVVLEKLMWEVPDIKRIYLMIRARKGQTSQERLYEEIMQSQCFERLRIRCGGKDAFERHCQRVLVAFHGELTQKRLGIADEVYQQLVEEVDFVIHSAASINFTERMDRAIELNTMGGKRVMELAKSCKRIREHGCLVHVSTCFVNCNKPVDSRIDERVYPLPYDIEKKLKQIRETPVSDLLDESFLTSALEGWANTYTFTKAMGEHIILRERGDLPVAILRPAIVGAAWLEPFPGWIDAISAMSTFLVAVGLGAVQILPMKFNHVADVIPVDLVANGILVSAAALCGQKRYEIFHSSSICESPCYPDALAEDVVSYFSHNPLPQQVLKPNLHFAQSSQSFETRFFLKYSVPSTILNTMALFGGKKEKERAAGFEKMIFKVRKILGTYHWFIHGKWFTDTRHTIAATQRLAPEERDAFTTSVANMSWKQYGFLYAYGINRFCYKADTVAIESLQKDDFASADSDFMQRGGEYPVAERMFPDLEWVRRCWAAREDSTTSTKSGREMMAQVLSSARVQHAMQEEAAAGGPKGVKVKRSRGSAGAVAAPMEMVRQRAEQISLRMFADNSSAVLSGMAVFFRKIWRTLYEQVRIDTRGAELARQAAKQGPVLFLPTHRSYIDFLVVSYTCFCSQLPLPFIAAGEDFLGILFVRYLFRNSRAFFIRRSFMGEDAGDELYATIFVEYVRQLLIDGNSLEFFLEGTRSRTGKLTHPKLGMLGIATSTVLDRKVRDLNIVSISIAYEKTLEGDMYSNELLGNSKVRESLSALAQSRSILMSNFGSVYVQIGAPINVRRFAEEHMQKVRHVPGRQGTTFEKTMSGIRYPPSAVIATGCLPESVAAGQTVHVSEVAASTTMEPYDPFTNESHRRIFNRSLAYHTMSCLAQRGVCMPTHLVATLLLMYRRGITHQQLIDKVCWLRKEINLRGGSVVCMAGNLKSSIIETALGFLKKYVTPCSESLYEPRISKRADYPNMLALGQYRNSIVKFFFPEGVIAMALFSFDLDDVDLYGEGVQASDLFREASFLYELLDHEFIRVREDIDMPEDLDAVVDVMVSRGVLNRVGSKVRVAATGEAMFGFLCALYWPFVDSYFVTAMALFTLQPDHSCERGKFVSRVQWLATTLFHEQMLCFYESCSSVTLNNAVRVFIRWGILTPLRKSNIQLAPVYRDEESLSALVRQLSRVRKQPLVKKLNLSSGVSMRRNLVADVPMLAKL